MIRMAKKRPDLPPSEKSRPRTGDRHKARKTISFSPELVELLQKLADRNQRPVYWEARIAIENHLRAAKLLPDEPGTA